MRQAWQGPADGPDGPPGSPGEQGAHLAEYLLTARAAAGVEPHHFAFTRGARGRPTTAPVRWCASGSGRDASSAALAWVHDPQHIAATGAGVLAAVNGSGRVAAVSVRGHVIQSPAVGAGPHGIAVVRVG